MKVSILKSLGTIASDQHKQNVSVFCWICLTSTPDRQLQCCGHVFCKNCLKVLSELPSFSVPTFNLAQYQNLPLPKGNCCPLCDSIIHNVKRFKMPYQGLQEKYLSIFASAMIGSFFKVESNMGLIRKK